MAGFNPETLFNCLTFGKYEKNKAKKEASVFGGVLLYLFLLFFLMIGVSLTLVSVFTSK